VSGVLKKLNFEKPLCRIKREEGVGRREGEFFTGNNFRGAGYTRKGGTELKGRAWVWGDVKRLLLSVRRGGS